MDEIDQIIKEINRLRFLMATHLNDLDVQAAKLQRLRKEEKDGKGTVAQLG